MRGHDSDVTLSSCLVYANDYILVSVSSTANKKNNNSAAPSAQNEAKLIFY